MTSSSGPLLGCRFAALPSSLEVGPKFGRASTTKQRGRRFCEADGRALLLLKTAEPNGLSDVQNIRARRLLAELLGGLCDPVLQGGGAFPRERFHQKETRCCS